MTVLAVGRVTPAEAKAMGTEFPVLSDPELSVARQYGLVHEKSYYGRDAARPASLLIGPDRTIRWMHASTNIRVRPDPEGIFEELRK